MSEQKGTGWDEFANTTLAEDKKEKQPVYRKSFSNPSMYPELAQNRVLREKKDFTPEELEAIKQRLENDPKLKRQQAEYDAARATKNRAS